MNKICVVGTGYVGLVTGVGLADFGTEVICTDVDETKIEILNQGKIPIYEPGLEEILKRNVDAGRLSFSSDVDEAIKQCNIIFLAVGTPSCEDGKIDKTALFSALDTISENLNSHKIIVTKSTVTVGTGAEIQKYLSAKGIDKSQFSYVSNPEFLREGSAVNDFLRPDRVVIGTDNENARTVMTEVYRPLYLIDVPFVKTTVETAELVKYATNSFLATKISFINEMAEICDNFGADVHTIAKTMGLDGRISNKFLHPGPGFGGSCFPKDVSALKNHAKNSGLQTPILDAVLERNERQIDWIIEKAVKMFDGDIHGKTIAVLGLAFKQNTDDTRESPALKFIQKLQQYNVKIRAYDPIVNQKIANVEICGNALDATKNADLVALMTEWNEFRNLNLAELKSIMKQPKILDARNLLQPKMAKNAGFEYEAVGRNVVFKNEGVK